MNIPKEALALIGAASRDPTRWQLGGVRFESNGRLSATATDGHQLTRLRWNEEPSDMVGVTIGIEDLKVLKKALHASESHFALTHETGDENATAELVGATVHLPAIDGVYPQTDSILDRRPKGRVREFMVDPFILREQLTVLIGALGLVRPKGKSKTLPILKLTVAVDDKNHPFVMEGTDDSKYLSVTGMVMPIVKQ